ncbi:MAG: hypothetical protein V7764_04720 [Pseudomonas marincola]|jgi:hypothetical protein|uniref:hypothetical protein n=1 Tax=Pseudomonas marincola TaxID=437900 RepID=UPI003002DAE4
MTVQNPYLTNNGDIRQAKKHAAVGGANSLLRALTPSASISGSTQQLAQPSQQSVSGDNPARAAQMQAAARQPVVGPRGAADTSEQPGPIGGAIAIGALENLKRLQTGALQSAAGTLGTLPAKALDAGRSGLASLAGGNPETLPGGENYFSDTVGAFRDDGYSKVGGLASDAVSGGQSLVRNALGVRQAQVVPATQQSASATNQILPGPTSDLVKANQSPGTFSQTGAGNIVARIGAGGVPEFSNAAGDVAGASGDFKGSRIGDGIGVFSQASQGDSKLAYDRNERALAEREKMIQASRRGEVGEGGGRVTVVRDSSRAPTIAEIANTRLENRQANTGLANQQAQQGIQNQQSRLLTEALQRDVSGQSLQQGDLNLQSAQRLEAIRTRLADPALAGTERAAYENAYRTLTGNDSKRYITVAGGTNDFGGKDASKVFDTVTQQYVDGAGGGTGGRTTVSASEVEQTAKANGMSVKEVKDLLAKQGVSVDG